MGSVLSDLKSEREKRKISLEKIAEDTRISLYHLKNLEEGNFEFLPGGMYNRAFLRAYCEALGLDFQDVVRRTGLETSPSAEKPRTKISTSQRSLPGLAPVIVWAIMLVVSITGLFLSRKWIAGVFAPYFSRPQVAAVTDPPVQNTPRPAPLLPLNPEPSQPAPAVAEAVDPPAAAIQESSVPSQALRLEIDAKEKCWISVDRDGSPALRKLLEPGEIQSFNAAEKFSLIVGNAGGIHLKINGKPAKPLGKPGEVVRLVIDERNLQDLIAQNAG